MKNEKKRKTATAHDVAKLAGVSQTTVSRVFNKNWGGPLSEEAKERVLKAANDLGYTPNAIAHILTSKHSGIIGVIVSKFYDIFYYEVLNILTNLLTERNIRTMVFTSDPADNVNDLITNVLQYQVDGVIITSAALSHQVDKKWLGSGIPVVLFNGYLPGLSVSAVHSDNYGACIMMADYLVAAGHQKFAYISTENSEYHNFMPRQESFLYGLANHGINKCRIIPSGYSYESGLKAAEELFSSDDVPDGIFCAADRSALAIIDVARSYGYEVGKDVSITGFYAPVGVDLPAYSLTCLKQNINQLCKDAITLLLNEIENPEHTPQIITRPMTLSFGKSSRTCPLDFKKTLDV